MVNDKLIAVSMETKERLKEMGDVGDSYGSVVKKILDKLEGENK